MTDPPQTANYCARRSYYKILIWLITEFYSTKSVFCSEAHSLSTPCSVANRHSLNSWSCVFIWNLYSVTRWFLKSHRFLSSSPFATVLCGHCSLRCRDSQSGILLIDRLLIWSHGSCSSWRVRNRCALSFFLSPELLRSFPYILFILRFIIFLFFLISEIL